MRTVKQLTAKEDKDWAFNVGLTRLCTPEGKPTNIFGVENKETGTVYRGCSDGYGLVTNKDVVELTRAAINESKLDANEEIYVLSDGGRMVARYTFPNIQREVGTRKVGDIVSFRFDARNSYDLRWRASGFGGSLRLTCTNGATSFANEFSFSERHTSKIAIGRIKDALKAAISCFDRDITFFNKMAAMPIETEQGVNIIDNLVKGNIISARMGSKIKPLWQNPSRSLDNNRNLWTLYNSATEFLTHSVEGKRFELAQRANGAIGNALLECCHSPKYLEDMLVPVPVDSGSDN